MWVLTVIASHQNSIMWVFTVMTSNYCSTKHHVGTHCNYSHKNLSSGYSLKLPLTKTYLVGTHWKCLLQKTIMWVVTVITLTKTCLVGTRVLAETASHQNLSCGYALEVPLTTTHHVGTHCNCPSPKPVMWILTVIAFHQSLSYGYCNCLSPKTILSVLTVTASHPNL